MALLASTHMHCVFFGMNSIPAAASWSSLQPSLFADKVLGIAEALNKKFHRQDPGMYPDERTGFSAYTKCRSMNARFKREQKLKREFNAAAQGTGTAAGRKVGKFKSNWPLFDLFHECCAEGSPADQGEQEVPGSVHRSAPPGMPQRGADNVLGTRLCMCMTIQMSCPVQQLVCRGANLPCLPILKIRLYCTF